MIPDIKRIILNKIDLFMRTNLPQTIQPSNIFWWFSLSGGKDSFVMSKGIQLWYEENHYQFQGEGLFFDQWNDILVYKHLCSTIDWMPVNLISIIDKTLQRTNYQIGNQAPCSLCAQARKNAGDNYILAHQKKGYVNILARGLHLTDMATSFLWRDFWGINTIAFASKIEKGKPFERLSLPGEIYLSKPLCYVREFECESFAKSYNYHPASCNCPAYIFPSRRDIVEDSIRLLFTDDLWEFNINGITNYLDKICSANRIKQLSLKGKENKNFCLTEDFAEFGIAFWKSRERNIFVNYDDSLFLDDLGKTYLLRHIKHKENKLYLPKYYSSATLTLPEKMIIATVGPLWGSCSYEDSDYKHLVLDMQQELFGITIDEQWSQVNIILQEYYVDYYKMPLKDNPFLDRIIHK